MLTDELKDAFRWHRDYGTDKALAPGLAATVAMNAARLDVTNGKRRYPKGSSAAGAPFNGGLRWCERPADLGLRLVGYADEIACRNYSYAGGIDHTGWLLRDDDFGGEKARGVVFQLPAKDGIPRFVAGIADPYNNGAAAMVYFGEVFSDSEDQAWESCGGFSCKKGAREAAYRADNLAERYAEEERNYNRAWDAGRLYAETLDEIAAERESVKALLKERKSLRGVKVDAPRICATLRDSIAAALDTIQELRAKRDNLKSGDYIKGDHYLGFYTGDENLCAAFNDGAGETIL